MKNVTVVIPVYNDWETLSVCIESLKKYLESRNKVLLVNDMGDEWEQLESNILNTIEGYNNFLYYKNDFNMGFVKSCNRAVLELDKNNNDILLLNSDTEVTENFLQEMQKILYSDEKIGVVCPRSNRATFLSIPANSNGMNVSAEESFKIYSIIKKFLPKMEEIWTGVGFAFLLKRELITANGLFDEAFGRGYNEENDFCMRIRKAGYKIMKANYSFVFHMEGISFQSGKEELELRNSSLLLRRYPYYWNGAKEFEDQIDVIDYFADLLTNIIYEKKRILICVWQKCSQIELNEIINYCEEKIDNEKYEYVIVMTKKKCFKIKQTFHIVYSLNQKGIDEEIFMNRHSPIIRNIENIHEIDVDKDIKKLMRLSNDTVTELRKRWKNYLNLEEQTVTTDRLKQRIKTIKRYLYAHHIWMFILLRKIRKYL